MLSKLARYLAMAADIVVICGIFVAFLHLYLENRSEKVQNAINAIAQVRTNDFLKAYARLKTAYNLKNVELSNDLIDDLNYVMNTYDHLALLYINKLADKCVIKDATYVALKEITPMCSSMSYPKEYRKNIDKLLKLMDKEVCK